MNLFDYLHKRVNIKCRDGRSFDSCYVVAYEDRYDNIDPDEDSIGIKQQLKDGCGIELFESEIKSIEIVNN